MKIIEKFKDKINGVLTGFDRMIIKGHIMQLFSDSGKRYFLSQEKILLKDLIRYQKKQSFYSELFLTVRIILMVLQTYP